MTPYHHYPRVGLNYCRCKHCGNTLLSMMRCRIIDKRGKSMRHKPIVKYKIRRIQKRYYTVIPKVKRRSLTPPYKQRRESKMYFQNLEKLISSLLGVEE